MLVYLDQKNVSAGFGEGNGNGLTNAPRPSCDQCRVLGQGEHVIDARHSVKRLIPKERKTCLWLGTGPRN